MREGRNANARATPECLKATPLSGLEGYYVTKKLLETNKYIQSAQDHDCFACAIGGAFSWFTCMESLT